MVYKLLPQAIMPSISWVFKGSSYEKFTLLSVCEYEKQGGF